MKITHASTMKTGSSSSTWLLKLLRTAGSIAGWTILILFTGITGFFSGWVILAAGLLRSMPVDKVLYPWLVLVAITFGLAWLVARFIATWRTVGRVVGSLLAFMLITWIIWGRIYPDRSLFLARQVAWGESALTDYQLFPQRALSNAGPVFSFRQDPSPELFQTIAYHSEGEPRQMKFEEFLQTTHTTSFIVLQEDAILYEGYFNGYERDSILTSFSIAKSFTSALIGIAIEEGYIGSVDDLLVTYIPELKGRGLDAVTLGDLLMMSSGIRFQKDDEISPLQELTQFTDDGLSYNHPNLRSLALQLKTDGNKPGTVFNYNNYNTILLGMILERATGQSISAYTQAKIWEPLGMEYPASWSLDSQADGFELVPSGLNARAVDFARFGRLFLNNGNWEGKQIIPLEWVIESTSPDPGDTRTWHSDTDWKQANGYYRYQWWGRIKADGSYDYTALGHLGQYIYVDPQANMIVVRFGLDEGGVDDWPEVFQGIIAHVNEQTGELPSPGAWPASTLEDQGLDSAKMAEGLLAIQKNGTSIHSLMVLRNDRVLLDAYFYPYDGTIYHDLASVTKSVMTTLIGIAADQGRLNLNDPVLSFFPDREIANRDERKERITIRHLASMSSGLECDPFDETTLIEMRDSSDWVQFALDRKVVHEPGSDFAYCGPDMHLLSAILQQATGMSALEFAEKNLFGPLDIRNVYWPSDPQGVSHGWGDICLRPPDMAKLGSLFLHKGEWKGRQIVSSEWVESALQPHMSGTGRIEEYGYGWWIGQPGNEQEFLATGRGGQNIKVYPRLKLIVVTTGGGFEYSEIEPYMLAAIGDLEKQLPPNPAGVARLIAAVKAVSQGPPPEPVPPLPGAASAVSGQTFVFESNSLLSSFRLDFDNSAESVFSLQVTYEPSPRVIGVGLDGAYRTSRAGRPILARGMWVDADTFVIDYNEGPGLASYTFKFYFSGDGVILEIPGLGRYIGHRK